MRIIWGGMADVIDSVTVDKIFIPNNTTSTTKYYKNLLSCLKEKGLTISTVNRDEVLYLDDEVILEILYVDNKRPNNVNNSSIVIELNYGLQKFLFMADAEKEVEKILIEENKLQDIDVLKVGHHGSGTGTIQEFLDVIKPEISIVSVQEGGKYNNMPAKEVIARLKDINVVYRTDIHGTILIESDGKTSKVQTYEDINLNGLIKGATLVALFV